MFHAEFIEEWFERERRVSKYIEQRILFLIWSREHPPLRVLFFMPSCKEREYFRFNPSDPLWTGWNLPIVENRIFPATHVWLSMNPPDSNWTILFSHISSFFWGGDYEPFWICLNLIKNGLELCIKEARWVGK